MAHSSRSQGGGQILLICAGEGYYHEWGKEPRILHPGDVVHILANVKHWHGAKKDQWFQHLAIEVPGENLENEWCEPFSEIDYQNLMHE